MSLWTRIANAVRGARANHEIDEEFASHIEEAIAEGRDPAEARRAFGSSLRLREESRDFRVLAWLDSLRADAVFGWRQLLKNKVASAAAILTLALATGSCIATFRLIDALLLRPLPVAEPGQLYELVRRGIGFDGKAQSFDGWAYLSFARMRDAVADQAQLMAVSFTERMDVAFGAEAEMERADVQFVSGSLFPSFGLQPELGRLFTEAVDVHPGAQPYAVLSHDFWTRRFGQDRSVIGRSFHIGSMVYEIIGVAPPGFTGTEPGTMTGIFLPVMMHPAVTKDDWTWHRTLARVRPGVAMEPLRAKLESLSRAFETERAKGFQGITPETIAKFLDQKLVLEPAAAGASDLQRDYHNSLLALGTLVALVLLITCANLANLMTAQAAARTREMALRVSIGAGRARLVQLVLIEGACISTLAAALGGLFAWWSAPFVVTLINPPDNPVRLALPWDWRVLGFGLATTLLVTLLFGLMPALRASSVQPASALKGGEDPHGRRRLLYAVIAAQVAFCFIVVFVSGLFAASFQRLSHRSIGFSAERILTLHTVANAAAPLAVWEQVADHLRSIPGVEKVAIANEPILGGSAWNSFISVHGDPPGPVLAYFLSTSPGWVDTMKLTLVDGRDFRPGELSPGAAIVNESFARQYFNGGNPVGKYFQRGGAPAQIQIVGLVRDAVYKDLREPMIPVAYVPFAAEGPRNATFIVRTASANPLALAENLRIEVPRARSGFRVNVIRSQDEINRAQTIRERLLAMLALFFAAVALVLAVIGLYGVLDYSVQQRRREIGIRLAIGAPAFSIARLVTIEVLTAVATGTLAGLAAGLASVRPIESLFYDVRAADPALLAIPAVLILAAVTAASLPAVFRSIRVDPASALRAE